VRHRQGIALQHKSETMRGRLWTGPGFRMPYGLERRPGMNYDPDGCRALEEKVGSIRLSPLQALARSRIRGSKNYLTDVVRQLLQLHFVEALQ
jgi:hypothetical protein